MVTNATRGVVLAEQAWRAQSLGWQTRGMIGRDFAEGQFDALVIPHCYGIHTFLMQIAIDVLFIDRHGVTRGLRHGLRPWRLAVCWRAGARGTAIELPAGTLESSGTELDDEIGVEPVRTV